MQVRIAKQEKKERTKRNQTNHYNQRKKSQRKELNHGQGMNEQAKNGTGRISRGQRKDKGNMHVYIRVYRDCVCDINVS